MKRSPDVPVGCWHELRVWSTDGHRGLGTLSSAVGGRVDRSNRPRVRALSRFSRLSDFSA